MYSAYASVMDIELESIKVNLKGYLDLRGLFGMDNNIPSGYEKIIFETHLKSSADTETLAKLIETVESHCPVLDTFVRSIDVQDKVTVNGKLMDKQEVAV